MSDNPANLSYSRSHEWIEDLGDGLVRVGITDHAQDLLGDMVYIELPEAGTALVQGDACAVVESVKAASDVYAPLSGEVTEVNESVSDSPEVVNSDPFGDGWLFVLRVTDTSESSELLDADAYAELVAAEAH